MIVNLYVDHLMATPPGSPEEVWNATREHARLFSDAANRIGLTPAEYQEFRNSLLDGKAVYVRLPKRMDAMSGVRHGSVYAVHGAVINQSIMGWRVALADRTVVYVPQVCGNISLVRNAAVAQVPHRAPAPAPIAVAKRPHFTKAVAVVPKAPAPVPVDFTPPAEVAAPVVAAVVPVASAGGSGLFFLIPAAIGGLVAGVSQGGHTEASPPPPAPLPPCNLGSNMFGACQR